MTASPFDAKTTIVFQIFTGKAFNSDNEDSNNNDPRSNAARLERENVAKHFEENTKKRKRDQLSPEPLPKILKTDTARWSLPNYTKYGIVSEPARQNTSRSSLPTFAKKIPEFIHTDEMEEYSTVKGECLLCDKVLSSRYLFLI